MVLSENDRQFPTFFARCGRRRGKGQKSISWGKKETLFRHANAAALKYRARERERTHHFLPSALLIVRSNLFVFGPVGGGRGKKEITSEEGGTISGSKRCGGGGEIKTPQMIRECGSNITFYREKNRFPFSRWGWEACHDEEEEEEAKFFHPIISNSSIRFLFSSSSPTITVQPFPLPLSHSRLPCGVVSMLLVPCWVARREDIKLCRLFEFPNVICLSRNAISVSPAQQKG